MTTAPLFWDKIAAKYAKRPVPCESAYAKTLERTRTYLAETDRVLEVGCGTGTTALKLAGAVRTYTATDFSPAMIAIARNKPANGPAPDFRVAEATDDLPGAPFDAVLAFSLLHLVPDLAGTLRALHAQLKPGGYLITKTTTIGGSWPIRTIIRVMQALGRAPFVAMLTEDDLKTAIAAAGFRIVETGHHKAKRDTPFIVAQRQ